MSTTDTTSTHASTHIPHIVTDRTESHSPRQLYDCLQKNSDVDPHRADTLRDCVVDEVSYYRKEGRSGGAHEIVVARFIRANENGTRLDPSQYYVRIERLKHGQHLAQNGSLPPEFYQARNVSTESKTGGVDNFDKIIIAHSLQEVTSGALYDLVASFTPDPRTLNIVHCAVTAHAITERAQKYKTLQYMCMWYARMVFECLRHTAGNPTAVPGPAYDRAGRVALLPMPLVRADGSLQFQWTQGRTLEEMADHYVMLVRQQPIARGGESLPDDVQVIRDDFIAEYQQHSEIRIPPLSELQMYIASLLRSVWRVIETQTSEAYKRVYREALLWMEVERLRAEAVELRAELAVARGALSIGGG